jgi:hypothetical protein
MHIVQNTTNFKDATEFLQMYLPHRAHFLPIDKKLSAREVLGNMWNDFPKQQQQELDVAMYFLTVFGHLPFSLDNPNAGESRIYSVKAPIS